MKTKSNNLQKKLQTKAAIQWYLQVGWQFGTLTGPSHVREILKIDRVTYHRWSTGRAAAPYTALELLRLHAFGEPPGGRSTAWRGIRFFNDRLITEDGREFTPADIKAAFMWRKMAFNNLDAPARREIYSELRSIYKQA